ncbi:MAG: hypothetical protein Q8P46_12635 [Hyphomicrobiales bacterium]|nr:hypothetical protein [Hyphomicrobiales bacterium]
MNEHHAHIVQIATDLQAIARERPRAGCAYYRNLIVRQLEAEGWYIPKGRFFVSSRGAPANSGHATQRGVLDLIAWPPPLDNPRAPGAPRNPDIRNRPPPVLVELDKHQVGKKTIAKLANFNYPATARVVILTHASTCDSVPGIDTIICLGAS